MTLPAGAKPSSPPDEGDEQPDIVVTGQRLPGAVIGDIPPDKSLGPAEIRSYGVNSIADLLDELAPETSSGRGRGGEQPVVLLNGRRIASFYEIRDIPTEAILRVDILAEEVALKYGYRADQKVVNFVLRPRFRAFTGEANATLSTEGGGDSPQGSADWLRIQHNDRFNIDLKYQHTSPLFESDRDIREVSGIPYAIAGNVTAPSFGAEIDPRLSALAGQTVTVAGVPTDPTLANFAMLAGDPNVTSLASYRTLQARSQDASANIVFHHDIGQLGATVNGRIEATDSLSDQGLPSATFFVPAGDPFSPFGNTVAVDRYLPQDGPLQQATSTLASHLGITLDRDLAEWRFSLTGTYDRTQTQTRTDRAIDVAAAQALLDADDPSLNPFGTISHGLIGSIGRDRATSVANTGGVDFLATGPSLKLPAGSLSTSLRVGASVNDLDSHAERAGIDSAGHVSRQIVNGELNVDLPIASRRKDVLPFLGELSLNGNIALDHLSDFGTLKTFGYGLHWAPVKPIDLIVSTTDERGAPTPQQLGDPIVVTPNARVFDYVNGQTVDITQISGGNPELTADHRHVFKIGMTVRPFDKTDFSIIANYVHQRTNNAIASFPTPTVAIEEAFPDRFTRDDDGVLTQIDDRPVNFARETTAQLRMGFNLSVALVSKQEKQFEAWRKAHPNGWRRPGGGTGQQSGAHGAETGAPAGAAASANGAPPQEAPGGDQPPPPPDGGGGPPPGGFGGGPPGGGGGFGGGPPGGGGFGRGFGGNRFNAAQNLGGRLQFAVYHTWFFKDSILIRDGVPVLNLLDGAATGPKGGQPQHQVDVQAGILQNGLGARLSATWQSGTNVVGEDASDDLRFHPFLTTSLRLFADLGQQLNLVRKHPWVRGMRVTFAIENALDKRLRVTDSTGATPISYQPDYLDPLGRTVRISIRKLFWAAPHRPPPRPAGD